MLILELAEKLQQDLERGLIESVKLGISGLVDLAFEVQNNARREDLGLQQEIDKLLAQLGKKQQQLQRMQRQIVQDLEKIELQLYEKNEYKLLRDVIEFVRASKSTFASGVSFQHDNSQASQPNLNEEAFYCSNSMNIQNTIILCPETQKYNEIVQTINKSSVTLSQKEQLVYNVIKSHSNHSQLQHVNLDDILDVSYNPHAKKLNTSILSSIPLGPPEQTPSKLQQRTKLFGSKENLELFTTSPKFQFSELSPIQKKEKHRVEEVQLHSFKKEKSQLKVPKINLEALRDLQGEQECSSQSQVPKIQKKRPKPLSQYDKQSFYDKSSILNLISKSRETRDTEKGTSNGRARNNTFHSGRQQAPQSQFLKDLMQKVHQSRNPQAVRPYKISDFEKKQLSMLSKVRIQLVGKLKRR